MTDVSTALVILSPSGAGPFNNSEWRIGHTIQLVEGGTNGPYWLASLGENITSVSRPNFLLIDSLKTDEIAKSLCLLLIAVTAPQDQLEVLIQQGFVVNKDRGLGFPHPWKFNQETLRTTLTWLTNNYRLGIVSLDEFSLLTDETTEYLGKIGIACEKFMPSNSLKWI